MVSALRRSRFPLNYYTSETVLISILFYRYLLQSADDISDHISVLAVLAQYVECCRCVFARHYYCHADAHVKCVEHVVIADDSDLLYEIEDRQYSDRLACYSGRQASRYGARNVLIESAACDVRDAFDLLRSQLI